MQMDWRQNIGEVSQSAISFKYFKWTITNFSSLPHTTDTRILSPEFFFENQSCVLGLWSNMKDDEVEEWIGVYLWISPNNSATHQIHVKLGVQYHDGREYKRANVEYSNDDPVVLSFEQPQLLRRAELTEVMHSGKLTIFCEICRQEFRSSATVQVDQCDGILAA